MQQPGLFRAAAAVRATLGTTSRVAILVLGIFALLALSESAAYAQVTGKVIGTVTDRDTGQPLVGAQVVIEGTNLGNVSNEDGYYFINNVPVGVKRITGQYLGYQTQTEEERVLAGQTMTVDFALSSEVVQADPLVAVIEREPLVARDNTISKTRFTAEDARNLPVDGIEGVITLGAGVYEDESRGGFVIRGGRSSESATYVDGALITDFGTQRNQTEFGAFSVEEVDVITGGFNAEFGHAQSGIINIVTASGGREYSGNVRFTTDEISPEQSYGFNNLQASIGGPIIPDRLTFFGSLEATGAEDFFPAAAGFNPVTGFDVVPDRDGDGTPDVVANSAGSTEDLLPGNEGDQTRAQGKLTAFLPWEAKATATYLFSRDQFNNYSTAFTAAAQELSTGAQRVKTHDLILGYDQQIFQTSERNLNLQIRGNYHITDSWQGTAKTPGVAARFDAVVGDCGAECDVTENTFEADFLNYRFNDIELFFEDLVPGDLLCGGCNLSEREPDELFGLADLWVTTRSPGAPDFIFNRNESRYGLRADLDSQLNRVHRLKVGVEWNWIDLETISGNLTSSTFADVYDVSPRVGAAYIQDRLDYGDLVIDLGLRWDHWDPNTMFPAIEDENGDLFYAPGLVPCEVDGKPFSPFPTQCRTTATATEAPTADELAPRIGVAHPITDATQVRLSYGKFYQLPELRHFFASYLTDFPGNPNITYGNPNLDLVETTAFEAGITHLISENLVLDVVGYNRDRRGAIRLDVFQPGQIDQAISERRIFTNGDNGNVKGFDLTLSKRYSNYFSTDLAWSLQWARGTTSSPLDWATGSGFGRLRDPLAGPGILLTPPSELQPEDFDRLHNINWQFQLRFPDDFREGTALGTVFKNFGAFLVYNAQSGQPTTRREATSEGAPLEDFAASRMPWIHSGDIRLTKGFDVGDALDLTVFTVVQNFLDVENVVAINEITGRPDTYGLERQATANVPTRWQSADSDGSFPFDVAQDIAPNFQNDVGKWDLNGDGQVTLAEAEEILFEARRAAGDLSLDPFSPGDSPFNYGEPRQIRFGAEIRF